MVPTRAHRMMWGGGSGYAEFLEAMADPNHSEHKSMMEWYGHDFDPTVFEWERINQWLMDVKSEMPEGVVRMLTQ